MSKVASSPVRLAIAVPTYNESKNITKLIKRIKDVTNKAGVFCTVLIIDDNSPDGTGDIADKLAMHENKAAFKVQVLHRQSKQGFDKAYVAGFNKLLREDFTHIMQMDADLSHDPKYIPQFIQALPAADFVVGSRYIKSGGTPDWALYRRLLSRFGNIYARLFLGNSIHDYTGGFNLFSTRLIKSINPDSLKADGYGFLVELKYRAVKRCQHVKEVPIVFTERQHGVSKLPRNTILKNLLLVPKLALSSQQVPSKTINNLMKPES
jgi:dolichol-phosphate mannosyltransferase